MAGLQSGEGRMMIDSVVWAQHVNMTDTQTATSPYKMPRRREDTVKVAFPVVFVDRLIGICDVHISGQFCDDFATTKMLILSRSFA